MSDPGDSADGDPSPRGNIVGLAFVRRLVERLREHHVWRRSAELAFWLFLSLLPVAVIAGLVVSRLVRADSPAGAALLESLPRATREILRGELQTVAGWSAAPVALGATVCFLWMGSNATLSVTSGVERLAGAPREARRGRLYGVAATAIVALSAGVLFSLVAGVSWIAVLAGYDPARVTAFESSSFGSGVRVLLGGALWLGTIYGLFRLALPRHSRHFVPIAPGAILTVGVQVGVASGARFYLRELSAGGAFQAALSSLAIPLLGLYLSAAAVFVGVELNQQLGEKWRLRLRARRKLAVLKRRRMDALALAGDPRLSPADR